VNTEPFSMEMELEYRKLSARFSDREWANDLTAEINNKLELGLSDRDARKIANLIMKRTRLKLWGTP